MAGQADYRWMYTILPLTAVGSGLSVIVPLYILNLNGNVFDVGVAIALYSLVSIPASLLWGRITDDHSKRLKELILLSILGTFPVIGIMYLLSHVYTLQLTYALYALVATAASPAINIMLMGQKPDPSIPRYFSRYSIWAVVGTLMAYIPGYLVTAAYIRLYLVFLLALNLAALLLGVALIKEEHVKGSTSTSRELVNLMFAPLNMLTHIPNLLTSISLTKTLHKVVDGTGLGGTTALLLSVALFDLGMNLFNTSYIPYLKFLGLSYGNIFGINIFNACGQLAIYIVVLLLIKRINLRRYYSGSVLLRCVCYVIAAVPLFFLVGALPVNILAYVIGGFAYALWNVTASVMIYDHIRGAKEGYYVGLWVAILGAATVLGAFASGVISAQFGYAYTFAGAIIITLAAMVVFPRTRIAG